MPVTDPRGGEGVRQCVPIELRRRPRARERAHVHEQPDIDLLQERREFGEGSRGVADGEDGIAHVLIHFRSFVIAAPWLSATRLALPSCSHDVRRPPTPSTY